MENLNNLWKGIESTITVLPLAVVSDAQRFYLSARLKLPVNSLEQKHGILETQFGTIAQIIWGKDFKRSEDIPNARRLRIIMTIGKMKKSFLSSIKNGQWEITRILDIKHYDKYGKEFEPIDETDKDYWIYDNVSEEYKYIGPEVIETAKIIITKQTELWIIDNERLQYIKPTYTEEEIALKLKDNPFRNVLIKNYLD